MRARLRERYASAIAQLTSADHATWAGYRNALSARDAHRIAEFKREAEGSC